MQFLKLRRQRIFLVLSVFGMGIIPSAFGGAPPAPQLGVMQTAETLGKGGYMTTFGLFQFEKKGLDNLPEQQRVTIGNFDELHLVEFQIETFLIPARLTYGIGDRLDLILGATFSTGGVQKIIPDFYRVGDETQEDIPLDAKKDRRVYEQSLFDTVVGLKYNIKPDVHDGLPSVSVGGEMQLGFTADNQLNSDEEFIDHSPADSFPFVGIKTYLVGTQHFGQLIKAHAGLGSYLSSKSLRTTDSFQLIWQLGGEIAFSERLWIVGDFSRELPLSGVTISNLISLGFRYEISETAAFHVGYVSTPGFQFNLTIGGEKERAVAPQTPGGGGDLLF